MAKPPVSPKQQWGDITQTPSWQNPAPQKVAQDKKYLDSRARMASIQELLPNDKSTTNLDAQRTKPTPAVAPFRAPTLTMQGPDKSSEFGSLVSSHAGNTKQFSATPNTAAGNLSATNNDLSGMKSMGAPPSTDSTDMPRISDSTYGNSPSGYVGKRRVSQPRTQSAQSESGGNILNGLSRSLEFYHALTRHSEGGNAEILRAYQGKNE